MVATSIFIVSDNKEITNIDSNKVSSSSYCYSVCHEETVSSTPITKKHKMDSSSTLLDLDSAPRTSIKPRIKNHNDFSAEEWLFYTMAPRPLKRKEMYMADECLRDAPRLPSLDYNDNDCVEEKIIKMSPIYPRRLLTSLNSHDVIIKAPQLPYLQMIG